MPSLGLGLGLHRGVPLFSGLLNAFPGASAAYSLRRLGSYGGPVVEVRRSSDSASRDFTAPQVIDGTLTTFTGAGDGFVSTWYDQSGNANDATQATTTNQPKIVDSGSLVTVGGNPSIDFFSNSRLATASFADGSASSLFMVFNNQAANASRKSMVSKSSFPDSGVTFNYRGDNTVGEYDYVTFDGVGRNLTYSDITSPLFGVATAIINGSGKEIFVNGSSEASDAETFVGGTTPVAIGHASFGTGFNVSEVILYPTDETSNRVAIETNINAAYNIF